MIRYSVQSDHMPEMLLFLQQFPRKLDTAILPAMKRAVKHAYDITYFLVPLRTGTARDRLEYEVLGFGKTLTGVIGWKKTKDAPWYVNVLEYGARPHSLISKSRQRSRSGYTRFQRRQEKGRLKGAHVMVNGRWVTMKAHPGLRAYGFLKAGYEGAKGDYEREMVQAVDTVFSEIKGAAP